MPVDRRREVRRHPHARRKRVDGLSPRMTRPLVVPRGSARGDAIAVAYIAAACGRPRGMHLRRVTGQPNSSDVAAAIEPYAAAFSQLPYSETQEQVADLRER